MTAERRNVDNSFSGTKTIQFLAELNDPQLSLEDYENRFLAGLSTLFNNEFAILLLFDAEVGAKVKRKLFKRENGVLISDEVEFKSGVLFGAYDQLKFLQCAGDDVCAVNPLVDAPNQTEVTSLACTPVVYQNQLLGLLAIGNSPDLPLKGMEKEVFFHLVNILASHVNSVKLILDLEESNSNLLNLQQLLINSRNTLRMLFDNIPESFYIVDESYTLLAINSSRAKRAGALPQKIVGGRCYIGLFKLNTPCPGCLVGKTLVTNETEVRRMRYLQKDKTNLEWEIHTYPVPVGKEKLRQVILLEQNITEKRKLEAELIQSEKLAAVGQLAAGIAHDINNPLTSIIANAQMLIADLPEGQADLLQSARLIELAGTKATQVVHNLLSSARKEEFEFGQVDLIESIQSALMLLSHEYISRDIKISFDRSYDMPCISASGNHLQSVWMNLIMNAIEAIGDTPGKIDISSQYDGSNFIVKIQDNGSGIPDEYIGQIFEPFFTTKHNQGGTGLGLTSVRRIVQAHNGQIMVESEEGKGSTFTVVLPGEQG